MTYKENYTKIRNLKDKISFNSLSGNKSNMFCININESDKHRDIKYKVCTELIKRGFEVFTEVIFKNKKRADIVCFDNKGNGYIFEIVSSESEESIKNKINDYPIEFNLEFIRVDNPIEICI